VTKILIVEDESSFSDALEFLLKKEGFDITVAINGQEAIDKFESEKPDLVLLDLMIPVISGTEVCRLIRAQSQTPIIMVTAKDSEVDKVVGLELGADDYVTKPYSSRELLARINAVLRRGGASDNSTLTGEILVLGLLEMDLAKHIFRKKGTPIALPLREFELLEFLMRNPGRVLTRNQIIDRVWGSDYFGDTKTLDVHIKRLRGKIEEDPADPQIIHTIRGLGYKLEI
jgi:two-component system response regulator RegX3